MTTRKNSRKCRTGMDLREQNIVSGQQTETAGQEGQKMLKEKAGPVRKETQKELVVLKDQ